MTITHAVNYNEKSDRDPMNSTTGVRYGVLGSSPSPTTSVRIRYGATKWQFTEVFQSETTTDDEGNTRYCTPGHRAVVRYYGLVNAYREQIAAGTYFVEQPAHI